MVVPSGVTVYQYPSEVNWVPDMVCTISPVTECSNPYWSRKVLPSILMCETRMSSLVAGSGRGTRGAVGS